MKLTFPLLAASAAVLMVSTSVLAGPPAATPAPAASPAAKTAKAAKAAAKKTPIVCAVTGETIEDISKSAGTSVYKGKTYYFCCAGCKPTFDKNPAKFVKADVAKPAVKGAKPAASPAPKKA